VSGWLLSTAITLLEGVLKKRIMFYIYDLTIYDLTIEASSGYEDKSRFLYGAKINKFIGILKL